MDVEPGEREFLKSLGKYLHTTRQGLAVLKLRNVPPIGGNVVDEKGKLLGHVADVFGPVASPYASVKLLEGSASRLSSQDTELYLADGRQAYKRAKHGRS